MAPEKRKRSQDDEPNPPPRRATRRHPADDTEKKQLRSGRIRAASDTNEKFNALAAAAVPRRDMDESRGRRGSDVSNKRAKIGRPPGKKQGGRTTAPNANTTTRRTVASRASKDNIRPDDSEDELQEEIEVQGRSLRHSTKGETTAKAKPIAVSPSPQTRLIPPKSTQQQQSLRSAHTDSASPKTSTSTPRRPTTSSAERPPKPPPTPRSDRNIDKVVLGNICFKAWYPSYYGKEVLGDIPNTNSTVGAKDNDPAGGGKIGGRIGGGKRAPPPMLDRLYVCPCCFKYSRELVMWWEHVRCCEKSFVVPGRKVYTHPKGERTRSVKTPGAVDSAAVSKSKGKKKGDVRTDEAATEEVIDNEGEWSVWEVDGEKDRLFCQNLSLFAKLFLDNKSVFFDVTGFNYFLLAYTPPPTSSTQPPPSLASADTNQTPHLSITVDTATPQKLSVPTLEKRSQVVGFFSKEKLSWDNNNLACILVFPPWQRKGLGALLMGVSYEISRREGILGGPEKPISELGRKGYKRFWAGEIARWLLDLDLSDSNGSPDEQEQKAKENLVSIDQCSKATWIVPEDCLAVLREMGLVEDAGLGPAEVAAGEGGNSTNSPDKGEEEEDVIKEVKTVPRVRLDKEAIRRWVDANKIDLTLTCDPEGFVEGYAVKGDEGEEVDEA